MYSELGESWLIFWDLQTEESLRIVWNPGISRGNVFDFKVSYFTGIYARSTQTTEHFSLAISLLFCSTELYCAV